MEPDTRVRLRKALAWFATFAFIIGTPTAYARNWPPAVIVQSSSMMHLGDSDVGFGRVGTIDPGDLVVVKRVESADDVRTFLDDSGRSYDALGDVIVYYSANDRSRTPIIHRAMAYVEVDERDGEPSYRVRWDAEVECEGGARKDARDARWCVYGKEGVLAPTAGIHDGRGAPWVPNSDGFITKGDNPVTNRFIDPIAGISRDGAGNRSVVELEWIVGKARGELPWLGLVKLAVAAEPNEDAPPSWYVRVGSAYAPSDLWISLAIMLGVLIGGPLAYDGWRWWRAKRRGAS